ncbi:5'-nucleotidase C-terminal domain-containing protein [Rhizobium paknamense]|uniref:2',3'-cyclic-nucleotide 2'-phosphodiesterase (5'-nucleotidase family) n=1 Tax=Rhizobium paknamense TaxID=1206817 RepID=A0ABU0IH24_9HYPH|nr:5'-nucleotidase C-terminal domain-containing protein [Rhizobium paknamense]MDQ0457466.1 2',3'-cyclic-nucleotide 2'-phosphodiesterase (5'-nucleotidase family) [Rhizobium paknamense]
MSGVKVGVIGMAATIIDKSMPASFSTGRRFDIDEVALAAEVDRLRSEDKCQVLLLLSHLGLPQDAKLAANVEGIDVVLSGHTHNRLQHPIQINQTIIIQSGCHGSFLGRLDLQVGEGDVKCLGHQLIPIDDAFDGDPDMQRIVDTAIEPHRGEMERIVGETTIALYRNLQLHSSMDDLLLLAIATAAGTDVAFSNGWRYGAPIPPGSITVNHLWNMIPTNPPVSVVDMLASEIRQMMEESLESTFAADPYRQMGGYLKRFRGLTIYGKIENPVGHRIERIFFKGRELDDNEEVAVSFVTAQGVPEKFGQMRRNLSTSAISALEHFLAEGPVGEVEGVGRFVTV